MTDNPSVLTVTLQDPSLRRKHVDAGRSGGDRRRRRGVAGLFEAEDQSGEGFELFWFRNWMGLGFVLIDDFVGFLNVCAIRR